MAEVGKDEEEEMHRDVDEIDDEDEIEKCKQFVVRMCADEIRKNTDLCKGVAGIEENVKNLLLENGDRNGN